MSDTQKNNPQKNNTSEHEFILPPKKPEAEASPAGDVPAPQPENEPAEDDPSLVKRLTNLTGDVTVGALKLAVKAGSVPVRLGKSIITDTDKLKMMVETGRYLHDVRQVAGLTIGDLNRALDLEDKTLLEAVENGTATLSFELILRLAALLARHDPVPFVMRMTRTYNPTIWRILNDWGVGRIPLQYERERQFVNIFRRHDAARQLSDEGYAEVLKFTQAAFDMALHFVIEKEGLTDTLLNVEEEESP
ncbi:MAG: hypothetical protein KC441_07245 [Anaerolineales bacterium]|nr:hypothetical protein [Anaerolineales bacterium]